MATIVFVHAHPDDEASLTAGTMAMLADRDHRVVVVYATGGEHGSRPADLPDSVSTAQYRRGEAEASAQITGTARVVWLGYQDSGMTGWQQNSDPAALTGADPNEVAQRLAEILDAEAADVVVGYDHHGGYGHPDHIAVHHMVRRAITLASHRPRLLEATRSTADMAALRTHPEVSQIAEQFGLTSPLSDEVWETMFTGDDGLPMGVPDDQIAWVVDLNESMVERKRRALECHASQTDDVGMMLSLPPGIFRAMFGREYFVEPGRAGSRSSRWPFSELSR